MTLLGMLVAVPLAAWEGWAVSILWGWFVVPLGVPSLSVWSAAGLALVAALLTHQWKRPSDDDDADAMLAWRITVGLILPPWCLGFGWIFHAFAT